MSTGTVRLHRVLKTDPEKVYRAFLEPDAMAKWLPPFGFTCSVHHMDAKVGGTFRMSFRNFTTGNGHSFGGEYQKLVRNETIRLHGQVRRSEHARRNAHHCVVEEGLCRH